MQAQNLIYRVHALQRMFQRKITKEEVLYVMEKGEVIEDYPDDSPYPSQLFFGKIGSRPLHVVAAKIFLEKETIIVTVYEPDVEKWDKDFKQRKGVIK